MFGLKADKVYNGEVLRVGRAVLVVPLQSADFYGLVQTVADDCLELLTLEGVHRVHIKAIRNKTIGLYELEVPKGRLGGFGMMDLPSFDPEVLKPNSVIYFVRPGEQRTPGLVRCCTPETLTIAYVQPSSALFTLELSILEIRHGSTSLYDEAEPNTKKEEEL